DTVGALCRQYGALFHSDTVQTVAHFPIDVQKTPVDFLAGSAHKFHGPKGVGFLYVRNEVRLRPFIDGGAQERNMRGGTENLYGIVGLAKAFELACTQLEARHEHIADVRNYMKARLQEAVPGIRFNGNDDGEHLYTVLSAAFPPSPKSEMLVMLLDIAGVSASGGSACSSGAETGSHVLKAIGADTGYKTIRFSFSHFNTRAEVDFAIEKLKEILQPAPEKTPA
ncbi:MAG: aminotransferase class V-fold PLP-dependent enzyme, partial [Bacteroidetes bacterium]